VKTNRLELSSKWCQYTCRCWRC